MIPFQGTPAPKGHALDTQIERSTEKYDITDVSELYGISDDWLELIADEAPEDMMLLIKELLNDAYCMNITIQNMSKKLKAIEEERKNAGAA